MKNLFSKIIFSIAFLGLAFYYVHNSNLTYAQSDPLGLCDDGATRCAVDNTTGKRWHKGNSGGTTIIN